jgi:hypothetical protein
MPIDPVRAWSRAKLEPYHSPMDARTVAVRLVASSDLPRGTVLGQVTTGGRFGAYDGEATDGRETAVAILPYDCRTDAAGAITLASGAQAGGEHGDTYDHVPVYVAGTFHTSELTGLDSDAVADLGRLVSGSISDGLLRLA